MITYNKEQLHEYAKELFALCLEKGIVIKLCNSESIYVEDFGFTIISEKGYDFKCSSKYHVNFMPIWELIEKVKAL